MELNKQLRAKVDAGEPDLVLEFVMTDYTPRGPSKGWVPDGKYEGEILRVGPKPHPNDPAETWIEADIKIVGPEKYAGEITQGSYLAPTSDQSEEDRMKRIDRSGKFLASILSSADKEEFEKKIASAKAVEKVAFSLKDFVGRHCYFTTETDIGKNDRKFSNVQYFILRDEYEVRPGPNSSVELVDLSGQQPAGSGVELAPETGDAALGAAMDNGGNSSASSSFVL